MSDTSLEESQKLRLDTVLKLTHTDIYDILKKQIDHLGQENLEGGTAIGTGLGTAVTRLRNDSLPSKVNTTVFPKDTRPTNAGSVNKPAGNATKPATEITKPSGTNTKPSGTVGSPVKSGPTIKSGKGL